MAVTDRLKKDNKIDAIEFGIDFAFRNAKASSEIENQYLPVGAEELILLKAQGKITQAQFIERALEISLRD